MELMNICNILPKKWWAW